MVVNQCDAGFVTIVTLLVTIVTLLVTSVRGLCV